MIQSWREVLPGDRYVVRSEGMLYYYDQKLVTTLYQPLVGIEAAGLYFTFWQESSPENSGAAASHHHLMGILNLSLDRILAARKKLEAVGLLVTLKQKQSDPGFFIYRLIPPMMPDRFFHDDLLAPFLYHQIGPKEFTRLSRMYRSTREPAGHFDDLSAHFEDVFESIPSGERDEVSKLAPASSEWEERGRSHGPHLGRSFDFKALQSFLSDAIVSPEALTDEVRTAIEKLAFVYQVDPFDMSRAVESASLHADEVDIDRLRKAVRDFYRLEHGKDELPALSDRTQPAAQREMDAKTPETDEERLIAWYETNSPYQLLEQLGNGSRPQPPDLRLIEDLMFTTKLNPGVVNVLIDYVARVNHNNLARSFVEKVAGEWTRANVQTVRQAMALARHERRKRQQQTAVKEKAGISRRRGSEAVHREVVPEWIKSPKKEKSRTDASVSAEAQKRAKWLDDYLNNI
ncbi:MAG: DnaD domain protein [Sporolactobacillus sp.]|nr:DnaD domain protein [Sporolactobacillus sp.]